MFICRQTMEILCAAHERDAVTNDESPCEASFAADVLFGTAVVGGQVVLALRDVRPVSFAHLPAPAGWSYVFSGRTGFTFYCPRHQALNDRAVRAGPPGDRTEGA